ncbi:methyltransferase domain-containing protein [Brachyspira aalborgi]|uniref:Methyltransferase domain-containing protein n=1 Tax=Brachyspira aalborgi TaxID=29522 RepID=A0A5C8CJQ4_9SPIR|nr:methyltransferase domain-containing protein [Brachyspira aalborgi]TXJ13510.1 methyltransferase domain-containing protein [Brachyspira aalborgi]
MITNKNYVEQYKLLNDKNKLYYESNLSIFNMVNEISLFIDYLKPKNILDYGCGNGVLLKLLKHKYTKINIDGYDPAIKEFSVIPNNHYDMIINTDVLEHIPKNDICDVLNHIKYLSNNVFFCLHHGKAWTILPNGENAHITIEPKEWYHNLMKNYFDIIIPLKARNPINSIVITFNINKTIFNKYNKILKLDINDNLQIKYIFGRKVTKKQMYKIIKYIPIKFIRNFLTSGFIDLTDINVIKSISKDIVDDNWTELNYLYNKALVENNFEMVDTLSGYKL